jgi:hypothetical protein
MQDKQNEVLMVLIMTIHVSSLQFHLMFPEEVRWAVYDSFQSFLFFLYALGASFFMKGINKKYLQAWSCFMFGDFLDNLFAYEYLASNAGFITLSAYVLVQIYMGINKHEANVKTNTKHNNII